VEVGKSLPPLPKAATVVATRSQEKLPKVDIPNKVAAMSILSHAKEATAVILVQMVCMAVTKPSEEKQHFVAKVVVCVETTVEEVESLSGLNMQLKRVHDEACKLVDKGQRWRLFQTQCMVKGKACKLMVDGGSYCNGISKAVVTTLGLSTWCIPEPKHVAWLNNCGMLKVTHKVRVPFTVGDYVGGVECDVLPLEVCGLLLGHPWQYDRNFTHAGRANSYTFVHDGKQRTLKPMHDDQIKSDVELVVHKEKLHKAKAKSRLATPQSEEHDAQSVSVAIVSAMPLDDKPVVLVIEKKIEVKPLIVNRKNIATCSIVWVDKAVQTDVPCADRVSVQMPQRVEHLNFVRTLVTHFLGLAVQMHICKDGRDRQLRGPSITHLLRGRAKQVHVQQCKIPARFEKNKVEAPKYKLIWRRKEVQPPMAVSSQAGQEGGRGVEGRQDLKTATMHDDCVGIMPPFRADPHALRTTLFEGGG
jgi:hypothetical protein